MTNLPVGASMWTYCGGRDRSRSWTIPKEIAREIVDELTVALEEFTALAAELPDLPKRDDHDKNEPCPDTAPGVR